MTNYKHLPEWAQGIAVAVDNNMRMGDFETMYNYEVVNSLLTALDEALEKVALLEPALKEAEYQTDTCWCNENETREPYQKGCYFYDGER